MKVKGFSVLAILMLIFIGSYLARTEFQEDVQWDRDNYGKVIGSIIDSKEGVLVQERMALLVYSYSLNEFPRHLHTFYSDKKGHFSFELKPGTYCIYYAPNSATSKYSVEPSPDALTHISEVEKLSPIEVRRGQITRIVKEAYLAGRLKIVLVDGKGNKINPREKFYERISINNSISSKGILNVQSFGAFSPLNDGIDEGEVELRFLYPALYKISLSFPFIGHGDITFEIEVIAGQTIEKKVVIDMSNCTGVEGIVTTPDGTPIYGASVTIGSGGFYGSGSFITDRNGFYKIINIKSGITRLSIRYEKEEGHFYYKSYEVNIQENLLLRKDIILMIN